MGRPPDAIPPRPAGRRKAAWRRKAARSHNHAMQKHFTIRACGTRLARRDARPPLGERATPKLLKPPERQARGRNPEISVETRRPPNPPSGTGPGLVSGLPRTRLNALIILHPVQPENTTANNAPKPSVVFGNFFFSRRELLLSVGNFFLSVGSFFSVLGASSLCWELLLGHWEFFCVGSLFSLSGASPPTFVNVFCICQRVL